MFTTAIRLAGQIICKNSVDYLPRFTAELPSERYHDDPRVAAIRDGGEVI